MRLWETKRRLLQEIDYWRTRADRAERWNEPDETGNISGQAVAWMTCPIELPFRTIIERATISGPPWHLRLTIKNPDKGGPGDPYPLLYGGDSIEIGPDGTWTVTRAKARP